jgi:hypothetical protein
MSMTTPTRRLLLLTAIAALLGVLGGVAAWVLLHLIGLVTNLALFGQWGWTAPPFTELVVGPHLVIAALLGALVISLLAKWSPVIRGHGIPEAMEAVLTKQSRIAPRTAVAKPVSAAVAIGSGAPFGAEGPIIVTGGSLGWLIGQVIKVSPSQRKVLLAGVRPRAWRRRSARRSPRWCSPSSCCCSSSRPGSSSRSSSPRASPARCTSPSAARQCVVLGQSRGSVSGGDHPCRRARCVAFPPGAAWGETPRRGARMATITQVAPARAPTPRSPEYAEIGS